MTAHAGPPHREILRALYASVADTVIAPMQDVLGLPSDARMNTPGDSDGNWAWRLAETVLSDAHASELRGPARVYERAGAGHGGQVSTPEPSNRHRRRPPRH